MRKIIIALIIISLIGLFLRTYKLVERFGYGHDGDLYSWIVKDVVVDHHFRLIGQLTSTEGIFIGPLFYYLLIPFYLLFNMDPIGSAFFPPVIFLLTIFSYYFVFSKLFNKPIGLIATFIHSLSWSAIGYDRWMVPTVTTKLWAIWYLYVLIMLSRGQFQVLPILGLLIGLTWHIHLALLPAMLAVPIAIFLSKKLPTIKQVLISFMVFIVTSSPLILFEVKHHFIQLSSLIKSFQGDKGGGVGWYKFQNVLHKISENTSAFITAPYSLPDLYKLILTLAILASLILLVKIKLLKLKEAIALFSWVAGVVLYFTFSSIILSEYYFANLEIVFMLITSILLFAVFKSSTVGKYLILGLLGCLLIRNSYLYMTFEPYHIGYVERKAIAEYITADAKEKNLPCVGINYITMPGENVGFRYFFYRTNLKLAKPSYDVPVYSIVFPFELSKDEVTKIFGHMGVIPPDHIPSKEKLDKECSGPNFNLTEPMFGYVD